MSTFNFDLEDGKPVIQIVLNPVNAGRFVTFMAECDEAKKRAAQLEQCLRDTLEQLEGWVAWKCPKKHREEHDRFIAAQRAVLAAAQPASPLKDEPRGLSPSVLRGFRRANGLNEDTGEPA